MVVIMFNMSYPGAAINILLLLPSSAVTLHTQAMSAFLLTTYPVVKNLERFRAFHDVINTMPSALDWIMRSSSPFIIRGIKMMLITAMVSVF